MYAPRIDIAAVPACEGWGYPPPFDAPCATRTRKRLGEAGGLRDFGVNLMTLPPGSWSSQRHWHSDEDEFVYLLEGAVMLIEDGGETVLHAGDCATFPKGTGNGHHLINKSSAMAVYLELALPLGWTIHDAGDRERYLYFITAGIVSRFYVTATGASAEFAVTGNEGVIGIAAFRGGGSTTSRAVVLSPGYSYRLRADRLQHEFEHDSPLPRLLLRYTQARIAQIGLISACKRHHTLEQRLCRWILSCLDRLPTNEMALTQELIADMLGVRREGVTEAVGRLQKAGLIPWNGVRHRVFCGLTPARPPDLGGLPVRAVDAPMLS